MKALSLATDWDGPFPLTRVQLATLQVLYELIELRGMAPTYGDIANELELSTRSSVFRVINILVGKRWIAVDHRPIRIRILHPPPFMPAFDLVFVPSADSISPECAELLP